MMLSQNFLNWKQAQQKVNHCSKKMRIGVKGTKKNWNTKSQKNVGQFLIQKPSQNFDFCTYLSKNVIKHGAWWKERHTVILQMLDFSSSELIWSISRLKISQMSITCLFGKRLRVKGLSLSFYFSHCSKVSARAKKGEFSKLFLLGRSDKAFQELSFKKNSTKKYCFSAELLDIKVDYTLIVLITRWQVLSFWSNLSRNKSQGIVVSFYHAIHAARLVQMPSQKRRVVSVFVCNGKAEEAEKNVKLGLGWKLSGE